MAANRKKMTRITPEAAHSLDETLSLRSILAKKKHIFQMSSPEYGRPNASLNQCKDKLRALREIVLNSSLLRIPHLDRRKVLLHLPFAEGVVSFSARLVPTVEEGPGSYSFPLLCSDRVGSSSRL